MSDDFEKKDLRIVKTEKALYNAAQTLLTNNIFRKITVRDICEEALISRATFYSYYMDKYDLLRHWLSAVMPQDLETYHNYEATEKIISQFVNNHKNIIKNIMEDADGETIDIVMACILSLLGLPAPPKTDVKYDIQYVVVSNLLAGGIIQYVQWHIKNRFPTELMNVSLYNIVFEVIEKYQKKQL